MRVAYADPPYPGKAWMYRAEPTYGGEVDHPALIARLVAEFPHGWALSTSARALRWLLPLCPPEVRVCPWVKPHAPAKATFGLHNCWEALLVVGGRQLPPGRADFLSALPARREGTLPGRKPIAFCAWLFGCLGLQPGDELVDLFPGTGIVSRAWGALSLGAGETGRLSTGDASPEYSRDASPLERRREALVSP